MKQERTIDPTKIDFRKKFELDGKVIIITGGCGLIGRAFAEACAQFGAHVVLADIELSNPIETAAELEKRNGKKMLGVVVDVANKFSVIELKEKTLKAFGRIDGLINGHQNKTKSFFQKFEEYDEELLAPSMEGRMGRNLPAVCDYAHEQEIVP